jgi:hypothetical protein
MARPNVIKPGAVLIRDAIRINFAALDGEIAAPHVAKMAKSVLSFITDTELASVSSRGKIEGYDPPIERFMKSAQLFITKYDLDDMLAGYDEHEEEPLPELEEEDCAGSQRASPPSDLDIAEQRPELQEDDNAGLRRTSPPSEVNITEKRPEQPTAEGDPPAGSQQLGPFTRKRKLPSLFQTSSKTSPSPEMDLPTILDSPDSSIDWGGVGNERNLSEEPSPILDKGKGKQIIEQPTSATYAADRDELERERRIRAEHRVTANESISASAPIAALQTHHDNALLVTPPIQTRPIQHSPTSTTSTASQQIYQRQRFSVNEFGSPSFRAPGTPPAATTNCVDPPYRNCYTGRCYTGIRDWMTNEETGGYLYMSSSSDRQSIILLLLFILIPVRLLTPIHSVPVL